MTRENLGLTFIDSEDAAEGDCRLCVETIQRCRFRWLCATCQRNHTATVCYNCSHVLDFGTDHGEPHRVALVAAADDYFDALVAEVSGRPLDEVREGTISGAGPARHLPALEAVRP